MSRRCARCGSNCRPPRGVDRCAPLRTSPISRSRRPDDLTGHTTDPGIRRGGMPLRHVRRSLLPLAGSRGHRTDRRGALSPGRPLCHADSLLAEPGRSRTARPGAHRPRCVSLRLCWSATPTSTTSSTCLRLPGRRGRWLSARATVVSFYASTAYRRARSGRSAPAADGHCRRSRRRPWPPPTSAHRALFPPPWPPTCVRRCAPGTIAWISACRS